MDFEKKWDIKAADIKDEEMSEKFFDMQRRAKAMQDQRTRGHSYFSRVSHMQNLYDKKDGIFSEGSTQAIKRKIRAETIQRVPDGEIITQYDKNSIEQAEVDFLFKHKILTSEYDGRDMLKNLWRTFNASYDYGYGCVRTGFERDLDGDIRVSFKLIQWNDILPAPDCDFIEEARWYIVQEFLSYSDICALVDDEGEVKDSTYDEDVVHFLLENKYTDAPEAKSNPLADSKNGTSKTESVKIWTLYKRGKDEFITFVPSCSAVLRTVKNYDPRLDIPLHFLILEPDPDFPLGCSSVMWTLAQQQFADAFQTSAYQTLLLAANPPLMQFGNLSNAKIQMKPRKIWNMGTNQNNRVEKFPVETTTITQYGSILNNVSANMMKNLNITESTVATDSTTMGYSGTPQGVDLQRKEKTITVNQYQKRLEIFFQEWANHAIRSYIAALSGTIEMTVDEETRRRIWSIESANAEENDPETGAPIVDSIINEDKISIDFNKLKDSTFEFQVRAGSLIQGEREEELENIQQLIVPVSQMMGNLSDENRSTFETILLKLVERMCELSNIDISASVSDDIHDALIKEAIAATMQQVAQQQGQINQLAQNQIAMAGQIPGMEVMPQEAGEEQAMMPSQQDMPLPMPEGEMPMPEGQVSNENGLAPSEGPVVSTPGGPVEAPGEVIPGQDQMPANSGMPTELPPELLQGGGLPPQLESGGRPGVPEVIPKGGNSALPK